MTKGIVCAGLAFCLAVASWPARPSAAAPKLFTRADLRWLDRVTYGIDSSTLERYKQVGRAKFLEEQLHPQSNDGPEVAGTSLL